MRFLKKGLAVVLASIMLQSTVWTSVSAFNTEVSEVSAGTSSVESGVNPVKIVLDNTSLYLYEGESGQIGATLSPEDATETITWSTNNTKVATVDANGKVFGVSKGTATITAKTTNGLTASCTVNVSTMPQEVFLDKTSLTMVVKENYQLIPSVSPDDAYATYNWSSSDVSTVKVDENGLLTALKVGTATIAVTTSNGISTLCTVKVIALPTKITLDKTEVTLRPEETLTLRKSVTPSNATADYVWKSSNTKVATVDQTGKVTGVALGEAEITVTSSNGIVAQCHVDVKRYPDSIAFVYKNVSISTDAPNNKADLQTIISPEDSYTKLVWKSSDTKVATVDQTGKVTGRNVGQCTVTVTTDNGKSDTCTVNVSKESVTIDDIPKDESFLMYIGTTEQFTATVLPEGSTCTWSSNNPDVVSVDENGLLTGKSWGVAIITASISDNVSDSRIVVCGEEPKSIYMTIDGQKIADGATISVDAQDYLMIVPELETEWAVSKVVWTYEKNNTISFTVKKDTSVVTLRGLKPGTCKLTVTTENGKTAQCTIKVVAVVQSIDITNTPQPIKMNVGQKITLNKKITPSVAVSNYTWKSSNEEVATVNASGMVTAMKVGVTEISVTADNGVSASCEVQVCPLPDAITIVPSKVSLSLNEVATEGQTVKPSNTQLSIRYTPENAYSPTLKWASSDTSVVAVNSTTYVITAKDTGKAEVTVTTSNSKTATCEVEVTAKPSSVRFAESPSKYWIRVGEKATLTPIPTPAHAITSYKWSSSTPEVATIDENSGLITAKKFGETTITVETDNGKKATFKLKVYAKPTKAYFEQSAMSMYVTQEFTFKPLLSPENSITSGYEWESSDTSVATVDKNGKVIAKKIGNTVISATNDLGQSAKCIITVYPVPETVTLNQTSADINVYKTVTLVPSITPENALTAYTWKSSDTSIATVDENGKVKGVAVGTATVTVSTSNNKTATCKINVKKAPTNVSFEKTTLKLGEGQTSVLTPILTPSNAYTKYSWTSSDTTVATVNSQGKVAAKKAGKSVITVETLNGKTATCTVTVSKGPSSVAIDKTTVQMGVGRTYQLNASITPSNAVTYCSWSTSKKSIATVSGKGLVTAKGVGTAVITVKTSNGKTAECKVTVKAAPTEITLNKTALDLGLGQTYTLQTALTPTNAYVMNTWSSSNSNIVSVNSVGKIAAKSVGKATITVKTYNGLTAQCVVTVKTAPESVAINKTAINIAVGQDVTLTSSLTPSDAYTYCSWSSSDKNIATVSSSGKVTGVKVGTAVITVKTSNGKTATCKVTVKKAPTAIALSKTAVTLNVGEKTTLTKTLTPSNAFSTYKWKSSNTLVATVNSNGEITAKGKGTATITVTTFNGQKATCKVTVK